MSSAGGQFHSLPCDVKIFFGGGGCIKEESLLVETHQSESELTAECPSKST